MNTVDLHYSITINAPREKLWDVMLQDETYRQWTAPFQEGSYYKGSWDEGSTIQFLGPDKDGTEGGMYAIIAENRPAEFLSIKHLGEIHNGVEQPWPVESDGRENYTLIDKDDATELQIDLLNLPVDMKDMFDDMWPQALAKLKEIVEAQ